MKRTLIRALAPVLGAALLALSASGAALAADQYVAMGDSYSSGYGANSRNLDVLCGRNTYAYPYLVAQQRANTSLSFVACGGATTATALASQLGPLSSTTKFVTITIGGNDVCSPA